MRIRRLSVIIPVFNEEKTVIAVLEKVLSVQLPPGITRELIIVNDASTDSSKSLIEKFISSSKKDELKLIHHEKNTGKGGSVKTALRHVTGDYFIIQDADLELNPDDYNILMQPILDDVADIVFGSRFLNNTNKVSGFSLPVIANKFLTSFSNFAFDTALTDMETCYKLIPSKAMNTISLTENRFGFEPEITAKLARSKNFKIAEVGVRYEARTTHEGKKIGWKDGFRAIWCIIKYGLLKSGR